MALISFHVSDRNLMRPPKIFNFFTVNVAWTCPALWRAQNDHGPARPESFAATASLMLMLVYFKNGLFHGDRHGTMHRHRVGAFNEDRCPAIALEQKFKLLMIDPTEDARISDLVAV